MSSSLNKSRVTNHVTYPKKKTYPWSPHQDLFQRAASASHPNPLPQIPSADSLPAHTILFNLFPQHIQNYVSCLSRKLCPADSRPAVIIF